MAVVDMRVEIFSFLYVRVVLGLCFVGHCGGGGHGGLGRGRNKQEQDTRATVRRELTIFIILA